MCTLKKFKSFIGCIFICASSFVIAAPGDNAAGLQTDCGIIVGGGALGGDIARFSYVSQGMNIFSETDIPFDFPSQSIVTTGDILPGDYFFETFSSIKPTYPILLPIGSDDVVDPEPPGSFTEVRYLIVGANLSDEVCVFSYNLAPDGTISDIAVENNILDAAITPVNVPIFTPIGILLTILGFIWFGRRKTT